MHVISGELRKEPFVKPNVGTNGESKLFVVELTEVLKDRKTGEKVYTNYTASLFAKGGQIDFYNSVLVEGNFIVVSSDKLKLKVSPCGKYTKLEMDNARLQDAKYIQPKNNGGYQQQQQAPQQQTGGFQPHQQQSHPQGGFQPRQQPQAPKEPNMDFDDDIPF